MTKPNWSPMPPRYVRRWAAQGVKPNGDRATTIFDLLNDYEHVAVYPATVDTFAVLVARPAIETLRSTLDSYQSCAVPAWHSVHARRTLCLRPITIAHEPSWTDRPANAPPYRGPMELYLALPNAEIHIHYARRRLLILRHILADITNSMDYFWSTQR